MKGPPSTSKQLFRAMQAQAKVAAGKTDLGGMKGAQQEY